MLNVLTAFDTTASILTAFDTTASILTAFDTTASILTAFDTTASILTGRRDVDPSVYVIRGHQTFGSWVLI
jgi:hypothetical protein